MTNIQALIADGGQITLRAADPVECAAAAADQHNTPETLGRRTGQTLTALIEQLDWAPGRYRETGDSVDEAHSAGG